jgi:type VI secretion system protein ImpJ
MPDGLHVVFAPGHDELQIDLRPLAPRLRQHPMPVHLAMPIQAHHVPDAQHRYFSYQSDPVADENTGDGNVMIPRLRPRLVLMADEQPPARFTSFPLLEVRCDGERFEPTAFASPTLHVASSSTLGRLCDEVSELLRLRALALSERAILSPQSSFGSEARSQIHLLTAALPALEALLRTEQAHPFALYLELCRVAGHVATLGSSLLTPVFPAYVHNDPRASFEQVTEFITRVVREGVPDTLRRFAFEQEDEAFSLAANPAWMEAFARGARVRVVLAARFDSTPDRALQWGTNCVIGGRSAIESLLARRVLGLVRRSAEHIGTMRPPAGTSLFELTPDEEVLPPGDDLLVLGSTQGTRPDALYLYVFDVDGTSAA